MAKANRKVWIWVAVIIIVAATAAYLALPQVDVITKISSGQGDD